MWVVPALDEAKDGESRLGLGGEASSSHSKVAKKLSAMALS
jgi:hypothetical protein